MRVAVAGAGAFGHNHLRVYRELEASGLPVALAGAVEPDAARAAETAAKYSIPVFASVEELLSADLRLDAASVAVPTVHHHAVASVLLDAGLDLLVEKPLTATLVEADELLALAERKSRILQPGHLERFNPAVLAVQPKLRRPMFFEAHRLSIFTPDLILLDLMMPRFNGDEVFHFIRTNPALTRVPVIVLSTNSVLDAAQEYLLESSHKRLIKSHCTPATLLAAVEEVLADTPAETASPATDQVPASFSPMLHAATA